MRGITTALLCAALFLPAMVFSSCASAAPAPGTFGDIEGREWLLLELRRNAETVRIDRENPDLSGFGEIYTAHFEDGRISGMGAPNRFFGPYTLGGGRDLSIGLLAHTLMMALVEPEDLREHEYFAYLYRVTHWDFRDGRLELHSSSEDGSATVLVFLPN